MTENTTEVLAQIATAIFISPDGETWTQLPYGCIVGPCRPGERSVDDVHTMDKDAPIFIDVRYVSTEEAPFITILEGCSIGKGEIHMRYSQGGEDDWFDVGKAYLWRWREGYFGEFVVGSLRPEWSVKPRGGQ